jgi:D-arabinose 1-dehydrogenase-like Zn-dependent alcohol dehydrogenase
MTGLKRGNMVSIRLVVVKCPECGAKLLAVKGDEVWCEQPGCPGYIKHAYGEEFIVAVGGKRGLLVAPVKKEEEG